MPARLQAARKPGLVPKCCPGACAEAARHSPAVSGNVELPSYSTAVASTGVLIDRERAAVPEDPFQVFGGVPAGSARQAVGVVVAGGPGGLDVVTGDEVGVDIGEVTGGRGHAGSASGCRFRPRSCGALTAAAQRSAKPRTWRQYSRPTTLSAMPCAEPGNRAAST